MKIALPYYYNIPQDILSEQMFYIEWDCVLYSRFNMICNHLVGFVYE